MISQDATDGISVKMEIYLFIYNKKKRLILLTHLLALTLGNKCVKHHTFFLSSPGCQVMLLWPEAVTNSYTHAP